MHSVQYPDLEASVIHCFLVAVATERSRVRHQKTNQFPNQLRVPVVSVQHTTAGKYVMTSLDWTSTLALGILRDIEPTVVLADRGMPKDRSAVACTARGFAFVFPLQHPAT